jgi:hypothetical protein
MKLDIWNLFENLYRKFKFHENPTRIAGTLHEDVFTFMTISRWILLRIRNVLDQICTENQTHALSLITFFPRKLCLLWDNIKEFGGVRKATYRHAHAHAHAPEHTHAWAGTNTQHVIGIAFPRQQWFANVPQCYVIVHCLYCYLFISYCTHLSSLNEEVRHRRKRHKNIKCKIDFFKNYSANMCSKCSWIRLRIKFGLS